MGCEWCGRPAGVLAAPTHRLTWPRSPHTRALVGRLPASFGPAWPRAWPGLVPVRARAALPRAAPRRRADPSSGGQKPTCWPTPTPNPTPTPTPGQADLHPAASGALPRRHRVSSFSASAQDERRGQLTPRSDSNLTTSRIDLRPNPFPCARARLHETASGGRRGSRHDNNTTLTSVGSDQPYLFAPEGPVCSTHWRPCAWRG